MNIKKKDGSVEKFNSDKIIQAVQKAFDSEDESFYC